MNRRSGHIEVALKGFLSDHHHPHGTDMPKHVLSHALKTSVLEKLKDKRVVLASNSPRRKELLRTIVRSCVLFSLLAGSCSG